MAFGGIIILATPRVPFSLFHSFQRAERGGNPITALFTALSGGRHAGVKLNHPWKPIPPADHSSAAGLNMPLSAIGVGGCFWNTGILNIHRIFGKDSPFAA